MWEFFLLCFVCEYGSSIPMEFEINSEIVAHLLGKGDFVQERNFFLQLINEEETGEGE